MKALRLGGNQSGYVAWDPCATVLELKHAGEEWALPDYIVTDHTHKYWEFHLQLSGATSWVIDNQICTLGANSLLGVAPGVVHRMRASVSNSHHFSYCAIDMDVVTQASLPERFDEGCWKRPWFVIEDAEHFAGTFALLNREITANNKHRGMIVKNAVDTIVALIDRHHSVEESPGTFLDTDIFIQKSRSYIESHIANKLDVNQLARFAGCSRSHLFHLFKRKMNVTPVEYHREKKIMRALELIKTGYLSLTEIAHELGFSSSQHFSTVFTKALGHPPSFYRKKP